MIELDLSLEAETLLTKHFEGLHSGGGRSSIRGGQTAADQALAQLDITGYAKGRSEVLPRDKRSATVLSPYIRHNLLSLKQVWGHVSKSPFQDREKFRDELLWQEYARHLYARVGTRLFENLRFDQSAKLGKDGWPEGLACTDFVLDELRTDGWLVNQTRMWMASHWTVRNGAEWLEGQEAMYRELIDGSRAANLLGWQWTVGSGTGRPYGFARWQVEKRAPGLCKSCPMRNACPIEDFPEDISLQPVDPDPRLKFDDDLQKTTGPSEVVTLRQPKRVLLTIDSLGDADPAMSAHPELPVAFVFNEPALRKLQLSSKRLYFYIETLQDLQKRRDLAVFIGDPVEFAAQSDVAVTHAPVPSFEKFHNLAEVHPYPWLRKPHSGSLSSFSAWSNKFR